MKKDLMIPGGLKTRYNTVHVPRLQENVSKLLIPQYVAYRDPPTCTESKKRERRQRKKKGK